MIFPTVKKGDGITGGSILGTVDETPLLTHSILMPPNHRGGVITNIVGEGEYDLEQVLAETQKDGGYHTELKIPQMASSTSKTLHRKI